jgi:hypothetical protein
LSTLSILPSGVTIDALATLRRALSADETFSSSAVDRVTRWVADHGTLADAPYLYPEEIDPLTEVFISAFPEVAWDDPAWLIDGDLWTTHDALDLAIPAPDDSAEWGPLDVIPDAPDFMITRRPGYAESLAADGIELVDADGDPLPPIAGGQDIPPEYHPTPEDWAAYEAWCRTVDYLDGFNAARDDDSESPA